ncbi:polymorphic toxin type 37 domain-containing protein [Stenotrophomonas lacuserhaii]|uniref:polymorphic toxin type 37 domain-containing protein n=1 Tax=Stenotrophomonas lacuserhaii TaxID=2760084 RepID=UPI003558B7D1
MEAFAVAKCVWGCGSGREEGKSNVRVPAGQGGSAHGGPHWDVQLKGGGNKNKYPGGRER